jgi:hypothetical protein
MYRDRGINWSAFRENLQSSQNQSAALNQTIVMVVGVYKGLSETADSLLDAK